MTLHERLAAAVGRIAVETGIHRVRAADEASALRDGATPGTDARLEAVVTRLEALADELAAARDPKPKLRTAA